MDIKRLSQIVTPWGVGLNYRIRIYFFGSRLKETHRPDSDLDLAIEFLDPWVDTSLAWFDYHEQWERELSHRAGLNIDLQLYDIENENVRLYVKEKLTIIFESPAEPENDEICSVELLGDVENTK